MSTGFQVRGGLAKRALRQALEQAPEAAPTLPPVALRTLQASGALDWVSGDDFLAVFSALRAAVGDEQFRAIWRGTWGGWLDAPMVQGVIEPVLHAFGVGPASIFRVGAFAAEFAARGYGKLTVEAAGGEAVARVVGVPAELFAGGTFALMVAGAFENGLQRAGLSGSVEIEEADPGRGELRLRARWAATTEP